MTDDQGWGDTGYNGNPCLQTPNLDQMSEEGIKFNRWYAGAPVCSPTRGSCLTGRHPYRYGIFFANVGYMKEEEITMAEALKTQGYTTGHFGKWHLGTLTTKIKDSNRGSIANKEEYSPPWENGFDVCFTTEAKVPTYNPMINPPSVCKATNGPEGTPYGTNYWDGPESVVNDNLEGDDSKLIMDRALPFIQKAVNNNKPFLAVIWFHTPHLPVVAGPEYKELYKDHDELTQHYYGCITAMDEQIGNLRRELKNLDIEDNTMLWFCSDNGPEDDTPGLTGNLRGRKRSLYEGGIRVPGLLVWPEKIKKSREVDMPCSTLDYFPTMMDILGFKMKGQPEPIDGVSLLPLIEGQMEERPLPIGFESKEQVALMNDRYKLISTDAGNTFELYDILRDPQESKNIADKNFDVVKEMKIQLIEWRISCKESLAGKDYN